MWIFIYLPIRIAFENIRDMPFESVVGDIIVDSLFLLDTCLQFFVPVYDKNCKFTYLIERLTEFQSLLHSKILHEVLLLVRSVHYISI